MFTLNVDFCKYSVLLTGDNMEILNKVSKFHLLKNWVNTMDESIRIQSIKIQNVLMDESDSIIYLKISTLSIRNGCFIPRIVILEGNEIVTLLILIDKSTEKKYCLMCDIVQIATGKRQYVIPFGKTHCEIPTKDYAYEFVSKQCGLITDPSKYVNIIKETKDMEYVHSNCGPCDHKAYIYLYETVLSTKEILDLEGKETKPNIFNRIVDINDIDDKVNDFLSMCAILYYKKYKEMH